MVRLAEGVEYRSDNARFRREPFGTVLFRPDVSFFAWLVRFHTPFPLKCTLAFQNGAAHLTARLPIWSSLFHIAFLIAVLFGSAISVAGGAVAFGLMFCGGGVLFLGAVVGISLRVESKRSRLLAEEVVASVECIASTA
jgi:hypothetical protein